MHLYRIFYKGQICLMIEEEGTKKLLPNDATIGKILAQKDPVAYIRSFNLVEISDYSFTIHAPIEDQEVWACGITYYNSVMARKAESRATSTNCYDRLYKADRPQIFPKARGKKVIGPDENLHLRSDSSWIVPEPELVLVISSWGNIVGYSIGNDLSCRDIEGRNPLYQPQAKIWEHSCVLGPCIHLFALEDQNRHRSIRMKIERHSTLVFEGDTHTQNIIRPYEELVRTLITHRNFQDGVYLFTGTGIIPPDTFSLQAFDKVRITIEAIGELTNTAIYPKTIHKELSKHHEKPLSPQVQQ